MLVTVNLDFKDTCDLVFLTPSFLVGVLRNRPCLLVRPSIGPSVRFLNISETAIRIFLIFCMKLMHHNGTKVTEPNF